MIDFNRAETGAVSDPITEDEPITRIKQRQQNDECDSCPAEMFFPVAHKFAD